MGFRYSFVGVIMVLLFAGCEPDIDIGGEPIGKINADSFLVSEIRISTAGSASIVSKNEYIRCSVEVFSENDSWNYQGDAMIRGRGNSTWFWYDKKPYRLKLNQKNGLLGMAPEKDWVLLANYRDPTHLMNTFVFSVGRGLGMPFTNRTRYVELYLNDEYKGLYQVTEQVEQGKNRVNVDEAEGILISLDADDGPYHSPNETNNFWSAVYRMPVCVKYPKNVGLDVIDDIKNEFKLLENAIKSADYAAVSQLLNIPTFIDFLLIQELVYNVELAAPRSMYLHKDAGGKWFFGPLWDFDAGYDFDWSTMYTGHNYFADYRELVLGTDPYTHKNGYRVPSFFTVLFSNKRFVAEYKARWLEVKEDIMSDFWMSTMKHTEKNTDAMTRNATRWPINKNYTVEITRMKNWLTNRITYLSTVINAYPDGWR